MPSPISYRLTDAERAAYHERGIVIPDYTVPRERIDALNEALDWVIRRNPGVKPEQLRGAHLERGHPLGLVGHREFLDFALDPGLLDIVERIVGPDIILWSVHVFCKPGGTGREVPWHQDGQYWPIRPLATCTLWLALDDVSPENGCLRVIPGSHRTGALYSHHDNNDPRLVLNQELDQDQFDPADAFDVALKAGQFSLHDIFLIHGSNANTSGRRRAGMAIRYMPSTSHFDRSLAEREEETKISRANFLHYPIFLARGTDRCGRNDFSVGREPVPAQ